MMARCGLRRALRGLMLGMLAAGGLQDVRAQGSSASAVSSPDEPLALYAVKYGESAYPATRLLKGDASCKNLTIAWMFYAVKAGKEIVLVDTGFSDTNEAKRIGVALLPYQPALAAAGITPETVTQVVLTHTHSDHAANVALYPKATVIVNRREEGSAFLKTIGRERLVTFDESCQVIPGMTVRRVGGHTAGSSVVELAVRGKAYLLAGDEAYLPENLSKLIPVGSAVDVEANLKFLAMAKNGKAEVLTLHDPAVVKAGCVRQIAP